MIPGVMTLEIDNLTFSYETINVIDQLSLKLRKGSTSALIGASGSGKTTLLKLIIGFLEPKSGSLTSNGSISYLMQQDTLLPWRTVWDHLTLILELQHQPVDTKALHELLSVIGLKGAEYKYPHQLSGGMKRRVSLAQAILRDHSLLLMDEPFSSLDIHSRDQMFDLLKTIRKQRNLTILLVTHDYRDAITIADQILWLKEGNIQKRWTVDDATRNDPSLTGHLIHTIRQAAINTSV